VEGARVLETLRSTLTVPYSSPSIRTIAVDRYEPGDRATTTFAQVPAPPMGLAFDAGGVLWMTSGTLYEGPGCIWRVERTGASAMV